MASKSRFVTIFLFITVLFLFKQEKAFTISDIKVKLDFKSSFLKKEEAKVPTIFWSLSVTEDGLYIIPDSQEGNIKIFQYFDGIKSLKLIGSISNRGNKNGELLNPTFCVYNKEEQKLIVMDNQKRQIVTFFREGRAEFTYESSIKCLWMGNDIQLDGKNLIISGHRPDDNGNPYELYSVDIDAAAAERDVADLNIVPTSFLLPSHYKYGYNSQQEYMAEYLNDPNIQFLGSKGWFDIQGNDIYYAWEADLRIVKLSINSGGKPTFFGNKSTSRYIKPVATKELQKAYNDLDVAGIKSEWKKVSYVRNLFTTADYLILIMDGPGSKDKPGKYWIQLYTLKGEYIKDLTLEDQPDWIMCFDKTTESLYSLSHIDKKNPKILKYQFTR
jgi:hypothetical protein